MKNWTATTISRVLRDRRGESLVESVLAILLLAILFAVVTAMTSTALNMTQTSLTTATAQQQAVNRALAGTYTDEKISITFSAAGVHAPISATVPGYLTQADGYTAFRGG